MRVSCARLAPATAPARSPRPGRGSFLPSLLPSLCLLARATRVTRGGREHREPRERGEPGERRQQWEPGGPGRPGRPGSPAGRENRFGRRPAAARVPISLRCPIAGAATGIHQLFGGRIRRRRCGSSVRRRAGRSCRACRGNPGVSERCATGRWRSGTEAVRHTLQTTAKPTSTRMAPRRLSCRIRKILVKATARQPRLNCRCGNRRHRSGVRPADRQPPRGPENHLPGTTRPRLILRAMMRRGREAAGAGRSSHHAGPGRGPSQPA
jgi:hypothetical protein